jgi:hypothetical protein
VQVRSGTAYKIIDQHGSYAQFTLSRPMQKDRNILLCIPAAFTLASGDIDGFYITHGKAINQDKTDRLLGGAVAIIGGVCMIFAAPRGVVNATMLDKLVAEKGDLFQQFQVIADGHAERFRDNSQFQRRGIAIFKDGKTAIVESEEAITLTQFASDLEELGARQAAYTDMGPWDEGWYRKTPGGKPITIGKDRSLTYRQSNWLVFRQR